jgi:hypothetical protein
MRKPKIWPAKNSYWRLKIPTSVLIIGDSHTRALKSGCLSLGVEQDTLSYAGTSWVDANIRYHPDFGLHSTRRKWVKRSATKFGLKHGHNNMFKSGLPILMSCFYLGRRVNTVRWNGHDHVAKISSFDDDLIPVSEDFLDAYTSSLKGANFDLIQKILNNGNSVTVVAPPTLSGTALSRSICRQLGDEVQKLGAGFYDPWDDLPGEPGVFPPEFIHKDQRHGNDEYGEFVVQALIDKELLTPAPAKKAALG